MQCVWCFLAHTTPTHLQHTETLKGWIASWWVGQRRCGALSLQPLCQFATQRPPPPVTFHLSSCEFGVYVRIFFSFSSTALALDTKVTSPTGRFYTRRVCIVADLSLCSFCLTLVRTTLPFVPPILPANSPQTNYSSQFATFTKRT